MLTSSESEQFRIYVEKNKTSSCIYLCTRQYLSSSETHGNADAISNPASETATTNGDETMTDGQKINRLASQIAGSVFDDAEGTLEERLEHAIEWKNLGTDCDICGDDRDRLRLLLDAATGITSDLTCSDTNDVIREATIDEACASAEAGAEGHILIDGRRCYVAL